MSMKTAANRLIRVITQARLVGLLIAPNLIFLVLAEWLDARSLINLLNAVQISLAIGVCIAYLKPTFEVIFSRRSILKMETSETLIVGISLAWMSITLRTFYSIAWRLADQPAAWSNSDFASYQIFMSCCAGVLHLAAPHVIGRYVPPRRWINIGILVAVAIMAVTLVGLFVDSQTAANLIGRPR